MTKINIYCLFDSNNELHGVYSSIQAVHGDALKLANRGVSGVYIRQPDGPTKPTIRLLRNIFKGQKDVKVNYYSDGGTVTILKTGLKE